jgi:mannose/fructose/N-acetylgalactosamine-specific phosphotransferase system component IIB
VSIVLYRVDERLIHGQVVVGWARRLGPSRIVVVDDELAADALEQSIYRTGLPAEIRADFWSVAEAVARLPDVDAADEPVFVLTATLAAMARLASEGVPVREVNVGGIHRGAGRKRVLPYVSLDADEERLIDDLERRGVRVVARDVPTAAPVRLVERERA